MNDIMKQNCFDLGGEALGNADIKLSLEGWPCTLAILGVCATTGFVAWVKSRKFKAIPEPSTIQIKKSA
jgi:hypothetical protein